MIEKVGVYCRLSDEDRFKANKNDDSDSIINQRSMCLKYANQNNWNVVDIYSDDDFSGAGVERPDFNRLIRDCESGKINLVLCKSQSRFSRDIEIIEKSRYFYTKNILKLSAKRLLLWNSVSRTIRLLICKSIAKR